MGLKPDHWIRKMALEQNMIEPFVDKQVCTGVISCGGSHLMVMILRRGSIHDLANAHSTKEIHKVMKNCGAI